MVRSNIAQLIAGIGVGTSGTGVVIPSYGTSFLSNYPSIRAAAQAHTTVPFVVIVNPCCGPYTGSSTDVSTYSSAIFSLKSDLPNVKTIFYTHEAYAARSLTGPLGACTCQGAADYTSSGIEADLTYIIQNYGSLADGVMVDECTNMPAGDSYNMQLVNYIRTTYPTWLIFANTGATTTDATYTNIYDCVNVYEGGAYPSVTTLLTSVGAASKKSLIAYSAAYDSATVRSLAPYVGYMWISDDNGAYTSVSYVTELAGDV